MSSQNDGNIVQNYENKNSDPTMIHVPHLKEAPIPSFMKDGLQAPQAPTPQAPSVQPPVVAPDYAPTHPDTTGELTGNTAQLDLNNPAPNSPPPAALPANGFDPSAPNTNQPWGVHGAMPDPSAPNTNTPWGMHGNAGVVPTPQFLQPGDMLSANSQANPQPTSNQPTQQQLLNQVPLNQAIQNGSGPATPPPLLPAQGYRPFTYSGSSDANLRQELSDLTNWSSTINNTHQNLGQININHNTVTDPAKFRPDTTKPAQDSWWNAVTHFFGGIGAAPNFDPTKGQFGQAGTGAVGGILYGALLPWNLAVGAAASLRNSQKNLPFNQFSQFTGDHSNPFTSVLNYNLLPGIANGANSLINNVLNPALTAAQQPIFGGPANKKPLQLKTFDTHPVEPIAKTTGNQILNALRGQQYSFAGKQDANNPIGFGSNGDLRDPRTYAGFATDILLSHHLPNPVGEAISRVIGKAAGGVVRRVIKRVAPEAEEVGKEAVHPTAEPTAEHPVVESPSVIEEHPVTEPPGGAVVSENFERPSTSPTPQPNRGIVIRNGAVVQGTMETPAYKGFQALTQAEHAAPQAVHGANSIEKVVEASAPKVNPVLHADPGASIASLFNQAEEIGKKYEVAMPDGTTSELPTAPQPTSEPASVTLNAVDPASKVPEPLIEHNIASGNVVPVSGTKEVAETAALAQTYTANITRLQSEIERVGGIYDAGSYKNLSDEVNRLEGLHETGVPSTAVDQFANLTKAEQELEATRNIPTSSKTPEYRTHMADKLQAEADNLSQLSQYHEEISSTTAPDTHLPVDRNSPVASVPPSDASASELKQWLRENYKAKSTAPLPNSRAELAQYLHNESQYVRQSSDVHRQIAVLENNGLPPTPTAPPTDAVTSLKDLLLYEKAKLSALPDVKAPAVPAPSIKPEVLKGTTNLSEIASTISALQPGTQVTENLSRQPRTIQELDALARVTPAPDGKPILAPDALPSVTHSQIAAAQEARGATGDVYQRILSKSGPEVPVNTLNNASHVTVETSPAVPLGEPSKAAIVRIKGNADETLMQLAKKAETTGLTPAEQKEMDDLKAMFNKPSKTARVASSEEKTALQAKLDEGKDIFSRSLDLSEKRANGTITPSEENELADLTVRLQSNGGKQELLNRLQSLDTLDSVQQKMVAKLQNQLGFDTVRTPSELHNALGELEHPTVSDPEVLEHIQRTQLPDSQVGNSPEVVKATDIKLSAETHVKNTSAVVNHLYNELDAVNETLDNTYHTVQQTSDIGRRELPRDLPSTATPQYAVGKTELAKGRESYNSIRQQLIKLREQGHSVNIPTNSPRAALEAEIERIKSLPTYASTANSVNSKTFFHGTKVENWSPSVDWNSGGSRAEWGHGTYFSDNPAEAQMYADRAVNRNVPGDFGRVFGDTGYVHEIKPNVSNPLDITQPPESPQAMRDMFKQHLSEAGVSDKHLKSFSQAVDGKPLSTYYSEAEKTLNRAGINDEPILHNYSRSVSNSIRGMGYDAVTDGRTLNLLDGSNSKLLQSASTPANDALDQARQAFNADSRVAVYNPEFPSAQVNHLESAVTLQGRMLDHLKDTLEASQEVQKQAIDAMYESDRYLQYVAHQNKLLDDALASQLMHEQIADDIKTGNQSIDNPCEF